MKRVILTKRRAGPEGNFAPGTPLDLEDAEADALIAAEAAREVGLPKPPKASPVETAALEPSPETAAAPKPAMRKRGGRKKK